jgi:nicotinamidase-related amidase
MVSQDDDVRPSDALRDGGLGAPCPDLRVDLGDLLREDRQAHPPDRHRSRRAPSARGIDALAVVGGETDLCVLSTVPGAVDRGVRVVVVRDALCSMPDLAQDALLTPYRARYGRQVETVTTGKVLENWTR